MGSRPPPAPGTYPSCFIREGCHGENDPAAANWDATFGARVCDRCIHFPGNNAYCFKRDRVVTEDSDACFSHFSTTK